MYSRHCEERFPKLCHLAQTQITMVLDLEEVLVSTDATELDLTNAHLHSLDEVPIPETLSVS